MSAKKNVVSEKLNQRDPDLINAEVALKRAAQKARQRAGQAGIGVVIMQDGKIVEERPERSR
jgi:LDH2 family malate/lactate/ureidoglycolate dehydrogenase